VTERLATIVLAVEAGGVLACLLSLVLYAGMQSWRGYRRGPGLRRARQALRSVAMAEARPSTAVRAIQDLPLDAAVATLTELVQSLGGAARERLRRVAAAAGVTHRVEAWSNSTRWWRRLRAVRLLTQLRMNPEAISQFLDDPHPAVRAAAADAAVGSLTPATVDRLLDMLDDDDPLCRFAAKAALMSGGRHTTSALLAYLADGLAPRPREALEVASALAEPALVNPALLHSVAGGPPTRCAAAHLLARAGGAAATQRLGELLGDPHPKVRAAAAHGLGNLGHWSAAPALARAMADPDWAVRSAAATALRRIGAPGRIYLRQAARSGESPASDVAEQVLALPEAAMNAAPL
jgi:HEAT repeat protein